MDLVKKNEKEVSLSYTDGINRPNREISTEEVRSWDFEHDSDPYNQYMHTQFEKLGFILCLIFVIFLRIQ